MKDIAFARWWDATGKYLDPDTSDVSWFDKRKELASQAFMAGAIDAIRANNQRGYLESAATVGRIAVHVCGACGSIKVAP